MYRALRAFKWFVSLDNLEEHPWCFFFFTLGVLGATGVRNPRMRSMLRPDQPRLPSLSSSLFTGQKILGAALEQNFEVSWSCIGTGSRCIGIGALQKLKQHWNVLSEMNFKTIKLIAQTSNVGFDVKVGCLFQRNT
eukprot:2471813-Amphidinium_carterae.1